MATAVISSTNVFTQLHSCDNTTNVVGNAQALDTAVKMEGTASLSYTLTASKKTVDFTSLNASWSTGDCIRVWVNFALPSEIATASNGGLMIELSDGSNTAFYEFLGSDNYGGGWVLGSIDISTGTILSGTRPTGNITSVGIEITVTGTLRNATNFWVDNLHIGSGYDVYGGTSGDEITLENILAVDQVAGWGMLQKFGGVYFCNGKLNLGDQAGTNAIYFLDSGRPVSFTHNGSVPSNAFEITFKGNSTGVSNITIAGYFFQGDTFSFLADFNSANLDSLSLTGSTFKKASSILFTSDSSHIVKNCIFSSCGQIVPLLCTFSNNTITDYVGTDGAVLFPSSDENILNLSFINCDNGVEFDASSDSSSPTFDNFQFDDISGNYDVNNTSGSAISISKNNGSNPNSYNPGGSAVTFVGASVSVSITVKDLSTGANIEGARVLVTPSSNVNAEFPFNETVTSITYSGTTAQVTHTAHGMVNGDFVVISGVTNEDEYNGVFTISNVSENYYEYTMATAPSANAIGTIKATFAFISGLTNAVGVISTSKVVNVDQPISGWVRKSSSSPYYQQGAISGTVTASSGFSANIQLARDE